MRSPVLAIAWRHQQNVLSFYVYELCRRTIGVIFPVILDPIMPQVAIQRHSATDESEGISLFAETWHNDLRRVSED